MAITPQQIVNALSNNQEVNAAPGTLQGNYWVGSDGNVYVKAAGVTGANGADTANLGANNSALTTDLKAYGATEISNPGSGAAAGTGASSGSSSTPVSQATIDAINASIANEIQQNQNAYNTAASYNATQDQQDQIDNANQVQGNKESRATAVQNAEQAAASGNQGLKAVLASLGALNGTGQVLAGRAVADSANNDIGGADQTFQNNATAIQNAQTAYTNSAAERDAALKTALSTDNQNAQSTGTQDILNDAQNAGDIATYNRFLPQLVQATAPVQALTGSTTTYNPASVNSFAPTSGLTVTTQPSTNSAAAKSATTPVNSALFVKKTS
jgi:hypothetical protein